MELIILERRTLSINSCHKADDGTYIFIGTSRLHGICEILRAKLSGYADTLNLHIMNDGSGSLVGCICG